MLATQRRLVPPDEAALVLSLTTRRFNRLVQECEDLPRVTLPNGDVRFDPEELLKWAKATG